MKRAQKCNECQGEHLYRGGCPNRYAAKDADFMARRAKGQDHKCDFTDRSLGPKHQCGGSGHERKHHKEAIEHARGGPARDD